MAKGFCVPGCVISAAAGRGGEVVVQVRRRLRRTGRCPTCGRVSRSIHGQYLRYPADLPAQGRVVRLVLTVRRFCCRALDCPRRTFCERMPDLIADRARRTQHLAKALLTIGFATSASGGARLARALAMPSGPSSLLRLMHAAPMPPSYALRVIGVDDWAWRCGRSWGTIIVDLERHRPVALLPDRDSATLEGWLGANCGIEVVTRDRSTGYARAVRAAAPKAEQVADRWHLLANARQVVERWATGAGSRLRKLPIPAGPPASERQHPFPRSRSEQAAFDTIQARRSALHEEVQHRRAAGQSILQIAREVPLAPGTVWRYASASRPPDVGARVVGPSVIDPWLDHLNTRLAEGCENGLQLVRELRSLGYAGSGRQVHKWLQTRRTKIAPNTPHCRRGGLAPHNVRSAPSRLPGPKALAWVLTMPEARRNATDTRILERILQDEEARRLHRLVSCFIALVRQSGVTWRAHQASSLDREKAFAKWIEEASACGIRPLRTFAEGLKNDGDAVRAALTTRWSNA